MPICVSDVCTLRLVGGFGCCHIALYKWIDGWENRQEKSDRILSHLGSVKCKLKRQQHLCEHDGSLSWPQAACRTMRPFLFWSHVSFSILLIIFSLIREKCPWKFILWKCPLEFAHFEKKCPLEFTVHENSPSPIKGHSTQTVWIPWVC